MVSPSTRSMRKKGMPSGSSPIRCTLGTSTPSSPAALSSRYSSPLWVSAPPVRRRSSSMRTERARCDRLRNSDSRSLSSWGSKLLDLVEVLGDTEADVPGAAVLGHRLADVGDHPGAPVAQGDEALHRPLQHQLLAALQAEPGGHAPVEQRPRLERRVKLDAADALELAAPDDHAGLVADARFRADLRDHQAEVGAEGAGEPAIGVDRLPVARAPGVVAQPGAVDLRRLAVDGQGAARAPVLLVVGARETPLGVLVLPPGAAGAVGGADGLVDEVEADALVGVLAEGLARVGHLGGLLQEDGAFVVGRAVPGERLQHLEAHAGRGHGVVALDARPLVVEEHLAGREEEAERDLRVALVRPVADAQE